MPINSKVKRLYDALKADGGDVGTPEEFNSWFFKPGKEGYKNRKSVYDTFKADGDDVGKNYEEFGKWLGLHAVYPTVNKYHQQMLNSVDPNKSRASEFTHRAVSQAKRGMNNVRKPVVAKVVNREGKPTGKEFAITPAKTVEDLDREYAQETTKNWENELHDQMADADKDAAKISDMFKSFIGSTDEVGSVWGNMARGGGIAGTPHSVTTNNGILENTEARQLLAAGEYNRKRKELLQLEQDSRNGATFDNHSFFRGMYDAAKDTGILTGGASNLINAGSLIATKQDLDNGVHTKAGDMLMQQAVKNSNAQSQYGDNQGWMYTGGVITTNMAPFIVQIASAGFSKGLSTSIGKVVQGAASKVALGTMKKAAGFASADLAKNIGKVTGLTTKAFGKAIQYGIVGAAQANTVGLGNVANDVINRYTGQVYQDEQGNYKFGTFDSDGKLVHEGGEDFLTALVKGEAAQTIEFATELAGGGIDAVGTALKNFVTKGGKKIINKYNMENVSKVIDFLLNNKVAKNARYLKAGADRTLGKVEVNSIVGESLEEELGIIANTVFTGDNKISDLWDEKQQSQIWGGMLLSIGLMKGVVAPFHAYNAKQYYSYKHKLNKADVNLSQLLGKEKWEELRNQIDATTNEDMPEMVNKINRDVALGKNRQPVREYIQNLLIMRGYDIGNMLAAKKAVEDKGEGVSVKNMEKNQAYQQGRDAYGYDTHEIQLDQEDKQKSLAQLLGISEQQLASMSDEELESFSGRDDNIDRAIYDYQLSSARYEGVVDNARDQIDLEVQRAAQAVDMYTDKSRNTIRNATIKASGGLEDYGVYIISGNIATHDDGSIDVSNSDDMILYYDPTTNTVEHADAMMFAELGSEENADEVRSQAMADAKEKAIKETTGIIDGVVEVGTQFKTVDADGTEHTYEVLADNGDGTAMITIDGNVPTELVKGENVQIPYSFEDLQKMKDLEDQKRLEAAKAEREQMEKERAEQQTQETEVSQPSFDFNQILNDNGNVVLIDVLGKDGNTKYPDSNLFLIRDAGAKAKVVELKSDGTLIPHAVNKKDVATISIMTLEEYKQAMPSSMIEDNSGENRGEIEEEAPTIEGETAEPAEETATPESAEDSATEQNPAAEQTPAITLEDGTIVPMLEDGNPDFSKLSAAQTAELYDSQFDEDADGIVSGYVSDAKKALDKANNMTVKGKTFVEQKAAKAAKEKAIADAQAAYDSAVAIRDAYNERQLAKEENTPEGRKSLIEKARRKYARLKNSEEWSERPGDLWNETVGKLLHRLYDATGIDVFNDTPNTVYEYVASNVGPYSLNYEGNDNSKGVQQETGLSRSDFAKLGWLAAEGKGMTIDAKVHRLWENRPSNLESADTQEIRNALISLITSGQTAFQARDYILNQRIELAESALEEQLRQEEDAAEAQMVKEEEEKKKAELEMKKAEEEKTNENKTAPKLSHEQQKAMEEGEKLGFPAVDKEGEPINQNVIELANWAKEQGLEIDPTSKLNSYADLYVMCKDGFGVSTLVPDVGENINQVFYFPDNVQGEQLLKLQEEFNVGRDLKHSADMNSEITEGAMFYDGDTAREFKEFVDKKVEEESKTIEVPEDATDEKPLGEQLSEDKVPFKIEGGKSGETYNINDDEDRQRLINDNKVDDKDILVIDMPKHVHKAIKELCKKMGLKVQFLYMGARLNGWIENGTMYLALDTEKATQFVFGHEMTHAIKQKNPEAYKELVKVAMAVTTKKKFEEDLAKVYRIYHNASGYNNIDDFVEEVIADNIGKFINDYDLAQRFVLRLNHPVLATILLAIQKIKSLLYGDFYKSVDALERIVEKAYVDTAKGETTNSETGEDVSFSLRLKAAIEETETNPSDAQKESGNYKKGHIKFGGYDYTIENPKGSTRSGKDADGKEWKITMHDTYGYIRGKFGKDGDHLDMFINDKADLDNWNGDVFVVDQVNPDGSFDEHKVMYGYDSMDDAKKAYLANYSKGWKGLGNITGASKTEFDKWLDTSNRKLKPFADYAKVKFSQAQSVSEPRYSLKDIKPVGVGAFGNIYNQFRGNAKAAIEFLKKVRGGEAVGALHHKDIGDIDLVWGKEGTGHSDGYGLSKLVKYHPEVLDNLQEILNDMRVVSSNKNRVNLESETHKAGVRLTWDGERKSWLLTAFKKETSASDKRTDTAATSLEGDTALSQTEGSAAKIDNSSETAKENGEKFSLKDEKTLAGVHNITEEKLRKAIKQGGLANPSVAVIDSSKQNHEDYGDISLILPSDKVAKRTGKNAGTWQGDAWTPTYPQVERQMSNKGAAKASKDVSSVPGDMYREVRRGLDRWLDGGEANSAMAYMFLHEKGVAPEPKKIQHKFSDDVYNELKNITAGDFNIYGIGKADAQKVLDMYIDAKFGGDKDLYEEKTKDWLERNKSIVDAGNKGGMRYTIAKDNVELYDEYGFNYKSVQTFVRDVEYDHRKTGVDMNDTLNEVEDYIKTNNLTDEFNTWLEGKEKEYGIKEVIFDGFTPSGNRRYVPNTLENVSKIMKKQGRNGATGISVSFQNFAASLMPSYGTLKDIRSKKGLLTSDHEDLDKFNEKWSKVFFELGMKCQPDATGTFDDYGLARLSEAAKTSDPQAYLKKEYNVDFSDEDTKRLKEMVKAIKEESPAMYFETKFERPVSFNEFSSAVVPTTASDEVKQALQNAGVQIYEYDKEKEGDRSRAFNEAINSSDNIRFSLKAMMEKPEGWKQANKKAIHIAEAIERDPKFSLKNLDGTLIKAGTYFSGGGLVEEGLKGIIDPVVAVEYDEKISGVYRNNFGQHIVTADVRDVDPKELVKQIDGEVEYFHASPVCKNYSQAKSNHAEVELDKETAASTAEFINAIKPKVVTIENVKRYKDSEAMKIITDALDANGYTWDADVYNAADYGGYTNRERLIVRAVRDGKLPEKPKKMARKSGWYEAVADIIPTLTEKKNGVAPWMDIRLKADGIDWRNIDKPLYVMGSAYADGKIPHAFANELLPTLRTKSGDVIVMPDGKVYRAMGRVLARVSGVSDDYKMPFSENLSHTIIGNGIPTQLTEHVIAPLLTGSDPKFSIRTYHGTGASFDKFDFSHMGEGEGSQAFGWGGYVTNSKDIAEDYTRRAKIRKDNGGFEFVTDMSANNKDMVRQYIYKHKDVNKGLDAMRKDLSSAIEMFPDDDDLKELSNILAKKNDEIAVPDNIAYLYDVDIPDDNGDYLDWENKLKKSHLNKVNKELVRIGKEPIETIYPSRVDGKVRGQDLYDELSSMLGSKEAASKLLSDAGFVGIKYPAGTIFGGAKEDDYNYVIFDENNANIVGNTRFSLRYDQFEHDLNQWKKDNNLPKDAQRPTIPQRNAGESAVDFLRRVDEYRKQMALWKTAPTYEQHLLSDDTALGEFNRELQRGSVLKRIAFQDSMLAIRKAQEAIMKEVGVDRLNMAEDAYTAENRSHGKGKNEFEEYNNEFLQPLRKAYHQMKKVLGDSYDNVRLYMMAKHGLERNAQMAFKESLEADYEDVAQRSAAYKAYKGDISRMGNDSGFELGLIDYATWVREDNAIKMKYSPSYMKYRYDKMGIAFDYSGLSALFDGSDFEEAAYKLVRDIESKHIVETKELWDATNAATKKILRDGYKAGMMSKDTYQYVRDMYSHYIPLRGWDGTTADQVWDYIGGGKGVFNQTLKKARGRTSIADDPIAYIENMAESGILLNNKNWVKQHLMLLAQNHPTSLLTLSKAWYVKSADANGNEEWIPATPQITSQMNSNQVKAAIDAFEKKMEQMAQTGDATQKRDGLNIAYPQTHSEEREHEVRVMKDGEEYVIYVNGDPQLAQAMNNTRAHRVREIQSGKLDRAAAWLGRKMAAAYTSLSPLFIPSNYFRDLTMTLASTAIREDGRYNYLLRKNLATSWNLGFMLRDYQSGKLREKVSNGNATPKEQMFYDFMMNGGETGFVSSLDVEDLKKKFKNDLKDLDRWKANPVKVGHTIMDGIEFLNRAIEDSNRFAIYRTSIQYGRSIDEAVNDAKDVTLNFNRKGTGEYGWQMIRNLYLFINPAVQSLQTLGALVKHHPFKFTAVTASWLASGVLVPIVNAALMSLLGGDDDKDKYWQLTKWDRRNNLIMWIPFTHEYVKIPLAQEFRAFYGVGDMIASKMMGGELAEESWSQYAEDLLGQVVDMLPLDPTGYDGNIAVSLMPNAIRPVFELAFNVDFTGKPLFKDTEYNKYDPNFTKAYVGTPDWLVRVSKMVNSIGNDYPDVQQNSIDAFGNPRYNLNNPGVVDHVLSSYLGGAYTMGSQVLGLLTKSLNDPKEIKMADIPLFSKFVSNPDDRPVTKKQGDEFWDMKENHDRAANTLSKLKKQAKVDGDYSMLERFYGSEEYKQYKQDDVKVKKYEEDKEKERAEESGEEYRPHKLNAEDIYKAHATPMDEFEDMKLEQLYTKLNGFKSTYDLLFDTAPSQSDGYYNANNTAIDAIDEITLDKQEISELKKGFLDDGKDAYNAEDMKRIRKLRKKVLAVLEKANKVVVANQKAKKK